jgi:hypothetical protein
MSIKLDSASGSITISAEDGSGNVSATIPRAGIQTLDTRLTDIAGLAVTDGNFIVGNGSTFVAENPATARTSLGLTIGTDVQASDAQLTDIAGLAVTDGNFIVGNGSNFVAESAGTARVSLGLEIGADVQAYDTDISKTDVAETRSASINMADNVLQRPELKDYSETKVAMGANDVDLSAGNVFTKTISGATTLTFSNPPATGKGGAFTLILTNGGSATITWPTSVDWAAATAPTLTAAGVDVLTFTTIDAGTIWYGIASGLAMA